MRPPKGTYPEYYENYIPLVKQDNIKEALLETKKKLSAFLAPFPRTWAITRTPKVNGP